MDEWRAQGVELWAAIERPDGRVVDFLLDHGVVVYPVNPKALDRARDRFRQSRAKSDPFDARVLADFLRTDHAHLRALQPSSDAARELKLLAEDYQRQIRQQTRLVNQLTNTLKAYYPRALEVAELPTALAREFLQAYPTPEAVAALTVKTRAGLRRRAEAGYSTGHRTFGYTSVKIGEGKGAHYERVIDEAQATAVRRAFDLCASGRGDRRIMLTLLEEGHPPPGSRGWNKGHVKTILRNTTYIGRVVYGRKRAIDRKGSVGKSIKVDPSEWTTVDAPQLRIVSDQQWAAVRARKDTMVRFTAPKGGKGNTARPEVNPIGDAFLAGRVKCGVCGGPMSFAGDRVRPRFYCTTRLHKSADSCWNRHGVPIAELDQAVCEAVATLLAHDGKVLAGILEEQDTRLRADAAGQVDRRALALVEADALDAETASLIKLAAKGKGSAAEKVMAQTGRSLRRSDRSCRASRTTSGRSRSR